MNILLINGSPKGKSSNTYKLTTAFIEGIKNNSDEPINIEELQTNKLEIKPCLGCFSCWNKTPGECVIKDDMKQVIEKLLWADITIWSFPLYYFNVPSKLKALIDRQLPMVLPFMVKDAEAGSHPSRYDMTNKKNVLISTCGFYTTKGNYDSVISMFNHLLGINNYEKIFCSQGELFRVPELSKRTNEYLEYVKTAGAEYIEGNIKEDTRKQLDKLLFPKETFEAMADASWGIEEKTNEKMEESLIFTKQMAALYNKKSYKNKDIILEMNYTDIDKTYQIILKKDGIEVLTENFKKYTTKIETPYTIWCDIANGKLDGKEALMKQLYKVEGDFDLMINWDNYFGQTGNNEEDNLNKDKSNSKTNMIILLLPWIIFWILTSINTFTGSLISIGVCAIISLVFFKNKKTIYDIISNTVVIIFSIIILLNNNVNILIPLSYLSFSLMWLLSCLTKIPLTAYYSANKYNGEKAFKNPLFMKTNKILTAMWGIMYIITSIITYYIIKANLNPYLGIINSVIPILMGGFTAWFQKWYPAKVARG
ncbi:MAG: NAD(P)H dehydrogenase [Clostridia bacterium]|jgi:multimeric flavodoxin WrbA|nr:NAD(P)H dehydrogenase [Clostridia bacterium]